MSKVVKAKTKAEAKQQGLNRYFTGKLCPKGHLSERITRSGSGSCVACARASEYERRNRPLRKLRETTNKKIYREAIRTGIIEAYGGRCACPGCDVSIPKFLCLDHVNGGGRQHRKRVGSGVTIYIEVRNKGYPKDKYRLLCWNCNHCYGHYGSCPHVTGEK